VKVGREAPNRGPHRVQRHRLLRAAKATVLGRVGCEELRDELGRQVRDVRHAARSEPGRECSAVSAVLADRVPRTAVGFELEKELFECDLDVHGLEVPASGSHSRGTSRRSSTNPARSRNRSSRSDSGASRLLTRGASPTPDGSISCREPRNVAAIHR
jgi:hypothetical protein